jgi:hypothetical protein
LPLNSLQTAAALVLLAATVGAMFATQELRNSYLWVILVEVYAFGVVVFFVGVEFGRYKAKPK